MLLLLLVALLYFATIREGIDWGDDPSMYILHAANIAEGRPYDVTGYVYNPDIASLGPRSYPPVFPALLAPVYAWRGMDLTAMKALVITVFLVSLPVIYAALRRLVPAHRPRVGILAVFTLSPLVRRAAEDIGSDTAFLLFAYAALLVIDRCSGRGVGWGVLAGGLIYLAFGTRFVGLLLLGSLLLLELWKARRVRRFAAAATVSAVALAAVQSALLSSGEGYLDQLGAWTGAAQNVRLYLSAFAEFFHSPLAKGPAIAIAAFALLSAGVGFLRSARDELTVHHLFAVAYLGVIVVWPSNQGFRFIYPILPLMLAFSWRGMGTVAGLGPSLLLVVLAGHAWSWTQVDRTPIREGLGDPAFQQLSTWIRSNTASDDVFIFRKPRVLALAAGRPAGSYGFSGAIEPFARATGARYVVVSTEFPEDAQHLEPWLRSRQPSPLLVFDNQRFRVFRLR
jgi:hypothetical protein